MVCSQDISWTEFLAEGNKQADLPKNKCGIYCLPVSVLMLDRGVTLLYEVPLSYLSDVGHYVLSSGSLRLKGRALQKQKYPNVFLWVSWGVGVTYQSVLHVEVQFLYGLWSLQLQIATVRSQNHCRLSHVWDRHAHDSALLGNLLPVAAFIIIKLRLCWVNLSPSSMWAFCSHQNIWMI